jgi:hypothetical protein
MLHPKLAAELLAMQKADLMLRQQLLEAGQLHSGYNKQMEAVHLQNANRLAEIIAEIGYPNTAKVGAEASAAAWLIIQHGISLPTFMKSCLKLAEEDGTVAPIEIAYLADRIAKFEERPQPFGTQFLPDENGKLQLYRTVESIEIVNRKRKQLGLCSVEEKLAELQAEEAAFAPAVKSHEQLKQEQENYKNWKVQTGWIKQ